MGNYAVYWSGSLLFISYMYYKLSSNVADFSNAFNNSQVKNFNKNYT